MALLRVGFTEPRRSPGTLVSSYLTVSPLPAPSWARAVCFLWHFPAGRPGLPLATTLPCGVRTFLGDVNGIDAAARSTRPSLIHATNLGSWISRRHSCSWRPVSVTGAVNAVAGGGSLITLPALLSVGLPPVQASVTNSVSVAFGYVGGVAAPGKDLAGQTVLQQLVPAAVAGRFDGCVFFCWVPRKSSSIG